jgi:hypothetical protein
MREDISYCVGVADFDEIGVRMDAVVEAVEVEEVDGLGSVVLQFCDFAGS